MAENGPTISVIIPHLNQADALGHCLDSLSAQTLTRANFEVIVVDNGSTTLPEAVVARFPGVILLEERRPGPGNARNSGVSGASGSIFAFIDADCRAHGDWLHNALLAMERMPPGTILGGDVQICRADATKFTALEAYESIFAYRFQLYIEQHGFSGTGNLIVRRDDFNHVGPFRGIDVAEDIDWGQRALAAGRVFRFKPSIVVYHPARETLGELCTKWDRHIQHAVNTARANPKWKLRWFARALAVLGSPIVDWWKVAASSRVSGALPRLNAVLVLVAIRSYRSWKMIKLLFTDSRVVWNRSLTQGQGDLHGDER